MVSPASQEEHPVSRIYLPAYFIVASSAIPIIISIYCLSRGVFDIFPHIFYIPIVLIAYAYPRKGIYGSVLLGGIYLGLVYAFAYPRVDVLSGATTRFFFLVAIGVVITLLSRRMQDEERKYHGIFDHAQDGVFLVSPDREVILDANPMAARLTGSSPAELRGMPFGALWQDPATPEAFRSRIAAGQPVAGLEGRIVGRDGGVKDVLLAAGLLPDGKIACSVADITDRIEAAKAVERERQELLDIIEFLPDATFVIDRDKKVIAWNRAIETMTGVPKAGVLGKGGYAYSVPFYGEARPVLVDLIFEESPGIESQYEWVRREGSILYGEAFIPKMRGGLGAHLWVKASPLLDRDGRIVGAIETVRDITERRMAEEALRDSEANYRAIFSAVSEGILIVDPANGRILDANEKACEMYGRPVEALRLVGVDDLSDAGHGYTMAGGEDVFRKALRGDLQGFEWRAKDSTGRIFWVEVSVRQANIGGKDRVLAVVRDITVRKQTEDLGRIQHKLSEHLVQVTKRTDAFRIATDALVRIEGIDATFACILEGGEQGFHPAYLQGFSLANPPRLTCSMPPRIERELPLGKAIFLHAGTADPRIAEVFAPEGIRAMALLPILAEGKVLAVLVGCSRTLDEFPSVTKSGLETVAHQVGVNIARILSREALEKSEALYRAVVEVQTEMISRFLPDGTHVFANEAYLRFFGKERGELIGTRFIPPIPDPDVAVVKNHFSSLSRENPVGTIEHRVILPSGEIRWMHWTDRAIFGGNGSIAEFQSVGRDITATKMMEEVEQKAFSQIEKNIEQLAILGDHIRNPLAVIVGIADLDGGPTSASIIQQARIIDTIITQLDRGWIESEKIREFLRKNDHNGYFR
ncbi:MAG TPA: PAS domain S-box protein [Methanomicrobiales archaeon]|nr:PAS domain S-box protein [Methanomicrobiales archaeon]